eukprot:2750226-Heterocapsa_arctica.AAC.1
MCCQQDLRAVCPRGARCSICLQTLDLAQDNLMVYDKAADDAILAKLARRRESFIDDPAAADSAPQQ